jgi:CP family cyanate transporter-like MFS transporter
MRTIKISNKYLVEAIVFISYTLFAMAWVGGTASMNQIMASMHIDSLASASFISGAVTIAKIVGTFAAAWLALKLGVKYAFFVSGILISIGLLTPFAPNYELLLISRFLMGLGGAFMIVYFNPIVMSWFPPEERATINGLNAVAFNLGTGIILWQMINLNALTGSWQNTLVLFSLTSLVFSIAWLCVEDGNSETQKNETTETDLDFSYANGLKDKFTWVYALTYSGILAFYLCLFTFYPKAGISQSALLIGFGIIGTLAGIVYSKKYPLRVPVVRWSGFLIVITVFTLSFSHSEIVQTLSAMVLGFSIFFPITALIAIPHELSKMTSQKITVVFSLFYSISYMVGTLVLWSFGKLVDMHQGDYTWAFALTTLVSSTFFIGSFFLIETGKKNDNKEVLCEG